VKKQELLWKLEKQQEKPKTMKISGGKIKKGVQDRFKVEYGDTIIKANLKISILRFTTPINADDKDIARYEAAEDSRVQKEKSFRDLGFEVVEHDFLQQDMSEEDFQELINQLNSEQSICGIIIQYPVPMELKGFLEKISTEKDLDALRKNKGKFKVPATSEGIFRVVEPFLKDDIVVAVVGSNGFVGSGVISLLKEIGVETFGIDIDDDLSDIKYADIIVSATGVPGIIDQRHLTNEQLLVVDGGYFPHGNEKLGDVKRDAVLIPQNYTPVPGGVGPIEIAILMERVIRQNIDPDVKSWKLEDYIPEVKEYRLKMEQ
jgi:methylenetetrahydrofolate dehydrogenase (NADP+) / methenyltetrahydrofolate cyclohydrolase